MMDERRLLDGEGTDLERRLLEASRDDAPSAEARGRTMVALGLGVTAAAALAPTAVHAATAVGGAGKAASGSITALVLAKWVGTGAVVGAVTAACIATATTPGVFFPETKKADVPANVVTAPAQKRAQEPRTVAPTPAEPAPAEPTEEEAAIPSGSSGRVVRNALESDPGAPAAEAVAPPASNGVSGVSLVAEVQSLDRARAALAAGDPRGALVRLADHFRHFQGGALEPEAVVLQVRALRDSGDVAGATTLARRFLAAHPDSSQAARLRALVGLPPR